jgi:tripartite-type tricarboxylate transporter receptor subunit TctC
MRFVFNTCSIIFCWLMVSMASMAALDAEPQVLPLFPGKPVEITVGFAPGGGVDLLARMLAQHLNEAGHKIVVENRPGAGSTLAAHYVAGRMRDGHSLLMMNDSYAIAPAIFKNLPYNPKKDLEAVSMLATAPMLLLVNAQSPYQTVADVVAAARKPDHKMFYASCGSGTSPHLAGELFNQAFGIKLTHVPYKGCGPALVDMLGGQVGLGFITISGAIPHIKAGKLRAMAITSRQRAQALPDVPTLAQSGAGNFHLVQWQGLAVPSGVPESMKLAIHDRVSKIMRLDDVQKKMSELGYVQVSEGPDTFQKIVHQDIDRFTALGQKIGLQLD